MRSTSFPGLWLMLSVKDFKSTQKHCFSKQYDTLTIIACEQALARRVGPWLVGPRRNWLRVNWHLTMSRGQHRSSKICARFHGNHIGDPK